MHSKIILSQIDSICIDSFGPFQNIMLEGPFQTQVSPNHISLEPIIYQTIPKFPTWRGSRVAGAAHF